MKNKFKNWLNREWKLAVDEWNHPQRNPLWFKCLFLGACTVSISASIIFTLFPNLS